MCDRLATAASAVNRASVFFHLDGVKAVTVQGALKKGPRRYTGTLEAVEQARPVGAGLYASEESLLMHGLSGRDINQGVKVGSIK